MSIKWVRSRQVLAFIQVPPGEKLRGTDAGPHRGRILPSQSFEREIRLQALQGLECHLCLCHLSGQGTVDDDQVMSPGSIRALADSLPRETDPIAISFVDKQAIARPILLRPA